MSNDLKLQTKRASFGTDETSNEMLSVSSSMPDNWPALNDHPYLDDLASGERSPHASMGA